MTEFFDKIKISNMNKYISKQGLEKIEKELLILKTQKRREIAEKIQQAKEMGDLSENAEYAEAKAEQERVENHIAELEEIIKEAEVIRGRQSGLAGVSVGSKVKVRSRGKIQFFSIVGSDEIDPAEGKISNESPLGAALLEHRVGDTVEVLTPTGKIKYKILKIY